MNAVVNSAGSAITALERESTVTANDAKQAFADSTRDSAFAAAGFLLLGLLATLSLGAGSQGVGTGTGTIGATGVGAAGGGE